MAALITETTPVMPTPLPRKENSVRALKAAFTKPILLQKGHLLFREVDDAAFVAS